MRRILASCTGLALVSLARAASAQEPEPLPPPPVAVEPAPQPPISPPTTVPPRGRHRPPREEAPPVDESTFVEMKIDADAPGVWLEALAETEGWVHLHFRWHTAVVYGRGLAWQRVCVAPCTIRVPSNLRYRVAGPSIPASDEFDPGPPGSLRNLHVTAGSKSGEAVGALLLVLGIPAAIVGVAIIATTDTRTTRAAGFVTLGVGAALVAGGTFLVATNGTNVHDGSGHTIAKLGSGVWLTPTGLSF